MFGFTRKSARRAARRGTGDAQRLAADIDTRIEAASRVRMASMAQAVLTLPQDWEIQVEEDFSFLVDASRLRAAVRRVRHVPSTAPSHTQLRYCLSVLFLLDCFADLTNDVLRREKLHLITGPITPEGVRVPSRMLKVEFQQQSAGFVAAEPIATHKQLVTLTERDAHPFLMCFHSHISHGADSTQPSQVDIETQNRFAAIGWDAVGGIFSLDGYIRFFSTANDFAIELYGSGADIISASPRETVVKLALPS